MHLRTLPWRRAPIALAALALTIGVSAGPLRPGSSAPQRASASVTTTSAESSTTSTTSTTAPIAAPAGILERAAEATPTPPPASAPPSAPARTPALAPSPVAVPAPEPAPKPPPAGTASETAQFIALLNQFRAANGLGPLSPVGDATAKAKQHSDEMASQGRMYHSDSMSSGLEGDWNKAGETIGMGRSVGVIERSLEESASHRHTMLNPEYNQVGVGVTRGDDGLLYVTEVFVGR